MPSEATWQQKISIVLLTLLTFVCMTSSWIAGWWVFGPVAADFSVSQPEKHAARYENGMLVITRSAKVKRPMHLKITRDLRRIDVVTAYGIAMPTLDLFANRNNGEGTIERAIPLDGLPAGKYELRSYVEWSANPLRNIVTPMPPLQFEVKP